MTGKQLRNSILQWAIQGKLVPQDPNDEPASVLLERIRAEKARFVKEKKIKKDKNETIIFRGKDNLQLGGTSCSANSYYEKTLATGAVRCIDDEIPFEIPAGWECVRLGGVIELLSGRDLEPSQYNSSNMGIPYMTGASNFSNGQLVINRWTELPVTIAHKGALLFTCKGTIGTMAYNTIGDVHIARQIMAITPYEVLLPYIQFFLEVCVQRIEEEANSIIPGISRDVLLSRLIALPPLNEQNRVISKVSELSPLLDRYGKLNGDIMLLNSSLNERLKKSVLQEAIQGRLVPQIESEGTAEELLEEIRAEKQRLVKEGKLKKSVLANESRIFRGDDNRYYMKSGDEINDVDEQLFEIPLNWRWTTLGELIVDSTGLSYKKEDLDDRSTPLVRVLRGGNIEDGIMTFKVDDVQISAKYVPSDLLLTSGTFISPAVSSLEKIGKTALVSQNYTDVVVGGFVLMLTPTFTDKNLRQYLYKFFQSPYYHNFCRSITKKSGQAFYNLSRQKLKQCPVPIPPIKEIPRILEKLNNTLTELSK